MTQPLPERLRYLEPVRKQLAGLGPDEIHEETDLSVLRRVVRKQVKGLAEELARVLLREDAAELERWLSTAEEPDTRLYFITPILPDAIEVLLTEQPPTPPERGEVRMELPEGAKVTVENGTWSVKWGRLWLFVYPRHREEMHIEAGRWKGDAKSQPMVDGNGNSVAEVRFGAVVGIKCTWKEKARRIKRVGYALDVPGGHIVAYVDSRRADFDESPLESYFHSMRVVNYPPAPEGQPLSSPSA